MERKSDGDEEEEGERGASSRRAATTVTCRTNSSIHHLHELVVIMGVTIPKCKWNVT